MSEDIKVMYNRKVMANVDKCIDKAVESWQAARKYTQIALVATLSAQYHHKDTETTKKRMARIVDGASGGNQSAIVEWAVKMGFKVDKEEGFVGVPSNEVIESLAGSGFKGAKDLHWWTLKPQKPYEGYDLKKALNIFVGNGKKNLALREKDQEKAPLINIDEELLATLEALAA